MPPRSVHFSQTVGVEFAYTVEVQCAQAEAAQRVGRSACLAKGGSRARRNGNGEQNCE